MDINVPFFFFLFFFLSFFLLIIPSNRLGRQKSQGSVLLESGTIAPSNEYNIIIFRSRLIKFPECENGIYYSKRMCEFVASFAMRYDNYYACAIRV